MPKVYIVGGVIILALMVYGAVDALMTNKRRVRGVPRIAWFFIILLLPVLGVVLWFSLGKDRGSKSNARRPMAPDDDPDFLRGLGSQKEQERRIQRLEKEIADLDDDAGKKE